MCSFKGCIKFSSYLVLLLAIVVGIFFTDIPRQAGLYKFVDDHEIWRGTIPLLLEGIPYRFNMTLVPKGALKGKNHLVTGANVGLGFWTSYHLASKGGNVILTTRSQTKCDETLEKLAKLLKGQEPGNLDCLVVDLASLKSVTEFSAAFNKKYTSLHSLILNAAIMMSPFSLSIDGIESQMATNHFGHFLMTHHLLDTLKKTATPERPTTIVAVTGSLLFWSYPEGIHLTMEKINDEEIYDPSLAYAQSKLANVLFTQELSERLKGANVLANSIHPGVVQTELARFVIATMPSFLVDFLEHVRARILWRPEVASWTQLFAAIGPELLEKRITGKYFHPVGREQLPSKDAQNIKLQKGLWEFTETVLKEKGFL